MKDIVCSCNEVERHEIEHAIKVKSAKNLNDIKRITGANTGCGKCRGYINDILAENTKTETKSVNPNSW
ncbi:MAG: (2Fe-2S)-binding protein [Marinifilaceae bacterium]|jgi:NAD(P)H-nitrite reductase large subunit|nr:(2Fe-2S)-binding protein [Marinifilaceae bacterium]